MLASCTPPNSGKDLPVSPGPTEKSAQDTADTEPAVVTPGPALTLEFSAQYIRTDGYDEKRSYPAATLITSADELKAYYDAYKGSFDLESRQSDGADTNFYDAMQKYGSAYFKNNCLALVVLEEPSGSNRHKVVRVDSDADKLKISIERIVAMIGTDDMAQWHIIIELPLTAAEKELRVSLTGTEPLNNNKSF